LKNTSFGLMRFFGGAGFLVLGLGFFYKGNQWFGLGLDLPAISLAGLGGKGILLLLGSMLVGLVGLLIGQGIGASISVKSDKVSFALDNLWHYGANSVVIWSMFSSMTISMSLGKEAAQALVVSFGPWEFALAIAGAGLIVGWTIAFQLYVVVEFLAQRGMTELATLLARLFPLATCLFVSVVQSLFFGVNLLWGVGVGFFAPFLIIPLSIHTRGKDEERRREMMTRVR